VNHSKLRIESRGNNSGVRTLYCFIFSDCKQLVADQLPPYPSGTRVEIRLIFPISGIVVVQNATHLLIGIFAVPQAMPSRGEPMIPFKLHAQVARVKCKIIISWTFE
jgi:hypothetical protein